MNIHWVSVNSSLPDFGERVLTVDVNFPEDGIIVDERIGGDEWGTRYTVTHWARLPVRSVVDALRGEPVTKE